MLVAAVRRRREVRRGEARRRRGEGRRAGARRRLRGRLWLGLGLGEAMRAEREMRAAREGSGWGCG